MSSRGSYNNELNLMATKLGPSGKLIKISNADMITLKCLKCDKEFKSVDRKRNRLCNTCRLNNSGKEE